MSNERISELLKRKPVSLITELDKVVYGQSEAKKTIASLVYNHYKHKQIQKVEKIKFTYRNALVIGATGNGKTFIIEETAKILGVPFVSFDMSSVTSPGYIGNDIEDCLYQLLAQCNDPSEAYNGIVFLDEVDKIIGNKTDNDLRGTQLQSCLLKMLEGTNVNLGIRSGMGGHIKTNEILFILGGSFAGMQEMLSKKYGQITKSIGFNRHVEKDLFDYNIYKKLHNEDLISYGMLPELAGRITDIVCVDKLTSDDLFNLLHTSENNIFKQMLMSFKYEDINLSFEADALHYMCQKAIEFNIGVRGLNQVFEKVLKDYYLMFGDIKNVRIKLKHVKEKFEKS